MAQPDNRYAQSGMAGPHRRRRRRGPALLHARRLQLHGRWHRPDGHRRLSHLHRWPCRTALLTPFGQTLYASPLKLGRHARPARLRAVLGLPHPADERRRGADHLLAVCSRHGPLAVVDLPGLHRPVDRADLLHHRGDVRRAELVGLHDQAGHLRLGLVPVHGRGRHHHRDAGQYVPAVERRCSSPSLPSASWCSRASPPTTRSASRTAT